MSERPQGRALPRIHANGWFSIATSGGGSLRGRDAGRALLHSLVRNHALVDGNKRLGWLATVVFLDLNGHPVELEDDDAFDLVIDVAEGRLDAEEIAEHLRGP